jgi:magnesium transporter
MFVYHLLDEIAERYLDLVDDLDDEIDELEDLVPDQRPQVVGHRLRELREDVRGIRRTLAPTRDAIRKVLDDRVELDEGELFPRDVEIAFGDAYDKFLRASEALESSRDALASVRDYLQGKISNDQNEVMKRLTMIASLLLLPTFIVGLYGQNFVNIPELHWVWGYWWSWGWIIATTVAQLAFFRWKRWF